MTWLIALAVMLAPQAGDGAAGAPAAPLAQQAGAGLWIGGYSFALSDIADVSMAADPVTNSWTVAIGFTAAGNVKFLAAQQDRVGQKLEISMDRKLIIAPTLAEPIRGGVATLHGPWSHQEAVDLVLALKQTLKTA